jgi:bifunctional lysine-specific demethylase and histidyl-hydroxylase NO66
VFVIQILGSKSWRIGTPAMEFPLPFQERQKGGPDIADACHKLVLHPHDVLYVPRGVLHDAVSEAELSCHITVGLHPKTYLDLILTAVTIAADRDPRFRKYLPPGSFKVHDGDIAAAVGLMRDISRDDFLKAGDAFGELLASEQRRAPTGVLRLPQKVDTVSEADFFQAIPNLMCSISQENDVVELAVFGRSIGFPGELRTDLELCLSGIAFQLADIGTLASPAGRIQLVRRLMLEGVVRKLAESDDRHPCPVDVIKHLPSLENRQ